MYMVFYPKSILNFQHSFLFLLITIIKATGCICNMKQLLRVFFTQQLHLRIKEKHNKITKNV